MKQQFTNVSDLRQQILDYFASQRLSSRSVEAILSAAQFGEATRPAARPVAESRMQLRQFARWLAAAACVAILSAVAAFWEGSADTRIPRDSIPHEIMAFFAANPELDKAPKDKQSLRLWLVSRGAPAAVRFPEGVLGLESYACQVLTVRRRSLYLSCFWREQKPVHQSDDLVHLLVGWKRDIRDAPASARPELKEVAGWGFACWSEGEIVYTMATPAGMEKLRPLLSEEELQRIEVRFAAR